MGTCSGGYHGVKVTCNVSFWRPSQLHCLRCTAASAPCPVQWSLDSQVWGGSEEWGLWSETRAQWEAPSEMTDRVVLFYFTQCSYKIWPEDMRHDQESIHYWAVLIIGAVQSQRVCDPSALSESALMLFLVYLSRPYLVSGLAAVSWPSLTRVVSGRRRGQDEEMFTFVCNMQQEPAQRSSELTSCVRVWR